MAEWLRRLALFLSRWRDPAADKARDDRATEAIERAVQSREKASRELGVSFGDRLDRTGQAYRRATLRHR